MKSCPHCGSTLIEARQLTNSFGEVICHNCGQQITRLETLNEAIHPQSQDHFIRQFFQNVSAVLFRPSQFFLNQRFTSNLSYALVLGLVCQWLGSAIGYLWSGMTQKALMKMMTTQLDNFQYDISSIEKFSAQNSNFAWIFGAGGVLLSPFLTLLKLAMTALFIFLGAKLFIRTREVTYTSILTILAYCTATSLFDAVPFIGPFISSAYLFFLLVIGIRQVYKVENGKAILVALFPMLIVMGIGMMILFLIFSLFLVS